METVCAKRQATRIAGSDFPHEVVRSRFLKLTSEHIHSLLMEKLNLALKQLSKAERDFILSYYDMEKPNMTVLASQYGVTRQAADKRLKKIQEKIKKLVAIF